MAQILNRAIGRQLTAEECCLLIDEAAIVVVSGNIRRSAGIRQFDASSPLLKENLWQQDPATGDWKIDPDRDALRAANHTRVYHRKPTEEECIEAVRKQFYSGEGAIQYAPEAIARASADLLSTEYLRRHFLAIYADQGQAAAGEFLRSLDADMDDRELDDRLHRYGLNPCGEIILRYNFCNLSEVHLNRLDPFDLEEQRKAFHTAGLFAAPLLHHHFDEIDPRYAYSRQVDPIVGVSFTGLFDFFVKLFGVDWLRWWEAGRPEHWGDELSGDDLPCWAHYICNTLPAFDSQAEFYREAESSFLDHWRSIVEKSVWDYCDRNGLRRPNRCTTVQPAGSKSLLTGASPGWHPPISARFIRRITFRKDDPIALACLDHGYTIVPSQSDKDENGNLLNDPFDPRCTEWLVEIPVAVDWADLPGADTIAIEQFSALAQFDFYMQVQTHYTTHNTSATISLREHEIEPLGRKIYQAIADDDGYISAALLARFDSLETFPRLPFEPIDRDTYDRLVTEVIARRKSGSFHANLLRHDAANPIEEDASQRGPAQCDSGKCWVG